MEGIKTAAAAMALFLATSVFAAGTLEEARQAYDRKEYPKALQMLNLLTQDNPKDAAAHLLLGHTALKLDKVYLAIEAFEKTTRIEPESLPAHLQLGFLYEKTKDREKARAAWQKVLELAPDDKIKKLAQKHLKNLGG